MNKYIKKHDYPLETTFDYNELDATLTLMHLEHSEKVYSQYKHKDNLYELISSEESNKLKITSAKYQCYTCRFSVYCACIVYGDCDDGRDFC